MAGYERAAMFCENRMKLGKEVQKRVQLIKRINKALKLSK